MKYACSVMQAEARSFRALNIYALFILTFGRRFCCNNLPKFGMVVQFITSELEQLTICARTQAHRTKEQE